MKELTLEQRIELVEEEIVSLNLKIESNIKMIDVLNTEVKENTKDIKTIENELLVIEKNIKGLTNDALVIKNDIKLNAINIDKLSIDYVDFKKDIDKNIKKMDNNISNIRNEINNLDKKYQPIGNYLTMEKINEFFDLLLPKGTIISTKIGAKLDNKYWKRIDVDQIPEGATLLNSKSKSGITTGDIKKHTHIAENKITGYQSIKMAWTSSNAEFNKYWNNTSYVAPGYTQVEHETTTTAPIYSGTLKVDSTIKETGNTSNFAYGTFVWFWEKI